jgi:hypothetical protein
VLRGVEFPATADEPLSDLDILPGISRVTRFPSFIVANRRQLIKDTLCLVSINPTDRNSRMHNDVVPFVCFGYAGHVTDASHAIEFNLGLRERLTAFNPSNQSSRNA